MEPRIVLVLAALVVLGPPSPARGTIITSVGYVFETFSPYTMIRFFEFSDRGWNISENCLKDMYSYLEGLRSGWLWAIRLYDASGYYGGGAFGSSRLRLHNPDLCRGLLCEYQRSLQAPGDAWALNGSTVPFAVNVILGRYALEVAAGDSFEEEAIQQLICFPRSCTHADLQQILEVFLFQSNNVVQNNTYLGHRVLADNYSVLNDFDFYVLISMILGSVLLYVFVHVFENYISMVRSCGTREADSQTQARPRCGHALSPDFGQPVELSLQNWTGDSSESTLDKKAVNFQALPPPAFEPGPNLPRIVAARRPVFAQEILDALSLPSVVVAMLGPEVCDVPTAQPGLFAACALLLTFAHVAAETRFLANNPRLDQEVALLEDAPTYLLDVYFFVSGSWLAQRFFKTFPREKLNVFEQLTHSLRLILHKIFSLTPSYTFALFAERLLAKHFHHNVALELPSADVRTCRASLWSNVLYMDTFFPLVERCMPWTWFISLEVQFFIIACLVLLLAQIHPRYAAVIGGSLFAVSLLGAAFIELQPPSVQRHRRRSLEAELMEFNLVFDNICLRIPPFLQGVCLGHVLHRAHSRLDLNGFVVLFGWVAAALVAGFFLFGHQLPLVQASALLRAAVHVTGHTLWTLLLFWVVVTSATQHGDPLARALGSDAARALAKVSPVALLAGPVVVRLLVFAADVPVYASAGQTLLLGLGCLVVVYACALALHVLLDGPLGAVLDVTLRRN